MSEKLRQLLMQGDALLAPESVHTLRAAEASKIVSADGAVRMVISTPTPVVRTFWDWDSDKYVEDVEVLHVESWVLPEISGRKVNLIDSHDWRNTRSVIGIAMTIAVEGQRLMGEFRLSKRASVADIVEGIREGVIVNGSCGYVIEADRVAEINGRLTVTTTRTVLWERSVVPVPAGGESGVVSARSAHDILAAHRASIRSQGNLEMTDEKILALVATTVASATTEAVRAAVEALTPPAPTIEGQPPAEGQRTAPTPPAPAAGKRSPEDDAAIVGLSGIAPARGKTAEFEALVVAGDSAADLRTVARSDRRADDEQLPPEPSRLRLRLTAYPIRLLVQSAAGMTWKSARTPTFKHVCIHPVDGVTVTGSSCTSATRTCPGGPTGIRP